MIDSLSHGDYRDDLGFRRNLWVAGQPYAAATIQLLPQQGG